MRGGKSENSGDKGKGGNNCISQLFWGGKVAFRPGHR